MRRANSLGPQQPARRLTRAESWLLAVPVGGNGQVPLFKRPLFAMYVLVFFALVVGNLALGFSFVLGGPEVPASPTDELVGENGNKCGYLADGCDLKPTGKPTMFPTPYPTKAPTTPPVEGE